MPVFSRDKTVAGLLLLCALLAGCGDKRDIDATLLRAWDLCESLKYREARPLVVECLLVAPDNAIAHYLLGKCYFNQDPPQLTLTKGEYDSARNLLEKRKDLSVLQGKMTLLEFQATLHCDTALALMKTVVEADKAGMPQKASLGVLKTALDHARQGLACNPESPFLRELNMALEQMVAEGDAPRKEPRDQPGTYHL